MENRSRLLNGRHCCTNKPFIVETGKSRLSRRDLRQNGREIHKEDMRSGRPINAPLRCARHPRSGLDGFLRSTSQKHCLENLGALIGSPLNDKK